jgi:O-antigen ligase
VLLNAVLYIRPMDFIPGLVGLPLYDVTFCLCFFFSLPALMDDGAFPAIALHPVSVCVMGVVATAILSNLLLGQVDDAFNTADWFFKTVLYYVLLICIVRTPARMKWLLASLVVDGCIVAGLGVADYKGIVQVPNLIMVTENAYVDGVQVSFRRLAGTGLFGDPNDLSLMIVGCVIYSMYLLGDRSVSRPLRALWLLPLPLLFQALLLTYSRGGAMALMIALGIYGLLRYGRRVLPLALLALPLLLRGGGRQTDFDVSGGTGQARITLWDIYIEMFLANPLLGVGFGQGIHNTYQVAHNSYIHVFAERGFFGGTAFLSAMLLAVWSLLRLRPTPGRPPDDELVRLRTFLMASVGSYAIGIMTLSRADVIPTYTILGLAVAYERMASGGSARGPLRLGPKLICLLLAASVTYLVVMYFFVKRNANYY